MQLLKTRRHDVSPAACAWCGRVNIRNSDGQHWLWRFGVLTPRGIAWDTDENFCSRWCFIDYYDDAAFIDWMSVK